MNLRPLSKHIFFTPLKLKSGVIAIPETARTNSTNQGVVIAVGPDTNPHIRVGDTIIYNRLKATKLEWGDEPFNVHEDYIEAVIREEE